MPTQHAIEIFSILNFAVIGLSLLAQPLAWSRFFAWLRREGEAGAMGYGFICLSFGSLIVAFHPVWHGLLAVLTVAGWLEVVLGMACLFAPAVGLLVLELPSVERPGVCRLGGIVSLALAIFIFVMLFPGSF